MTDRRGAGKSRILDLVRDEARDIGARADQTEQQWQDGYTGDLDDEHSALKRIGEVTSIRVKFHDSLVHRHQVWIGVEGALIDVPGVETKRDMPKQPQLRDTLVPEIEDLVKLRVQIGDCFLLVRRQREAGEIRVGWQIAKRGNLLTDLSYDGLAIRNRLDDVDLQAGR